MRRWSTTRNSRAFTSRRAISTRRIDGSRPWRADFRLCDCRRGLCRLRSGQPSHRGRRAQRRGARVRRLGSFDVRADAFGPVDPDEHGRSSTGVITPNLSRIWAAADAHAARQGSRWIIVDQWPGVRARQSATISIVGRKRAPPDGDMRGAAVFSARRNLRRGR